MGRVSVAGGGDDEGAVGFGGAGVCYIESEVEGGGWCGGGEGEDLAGDVVDDGDVGQGSVD